MWLHTDMQLAALTSAGKTGRPVKFEITEQARQTIATGRDITAPSHWK